MYTWISNLNLNLTVVCLNLNFGFSLSWSSLFPQTSNCCISNTAQASHRQHTHTHTHTLANGKRLSNPHWAYQLLHRRVAPNGRRGCSNHRSHPPQYRNSRKRGEGAVHRAHESGERYTCLIDKRGQPNAKSERLKRTPRQRRQRRSRSVISTDEMFVIKKYSSISNAIEFFLFVLLF